MGRRILIIKSGDIEGIKWHFQTSDFIIKLAEEREVLKIIEDFWPSVIIIDWDRLGKGELIKQIRIFTDAFLIVIASEKSLATKIKVLDYGADYFLTKPISSLELMSYVRASLRRYEKEIMEYSFDGIRINFKNREVIKNGRKYRLTPLEFYLLRYMIQHAGEVIAREEILKRVWGFKNYIPTRTIDQYIVRLRRKIEVNPRKPRYIITVHGYGYRFCLS